jgi:hypothetical protein
MNPGSPTESNPTRCSLPLLLKWPKGATINFVQKRYDYTFPLQTNDWFWMRCRKDPNTIKIILLMIYFWLWTKSGPEMAASKWRRLWWCIWTIQCVTA